MGCDYYSEHDGIVTITITDYDTDETIFSGTFKVKAGQRLAHEISGDSERVIVSR